MAPVGYLRSFLLSSLRSFFVAEHKLLGLGYFRVPDVAELMVVVLNLVIENVVCLGVLEEVFLVMLEPAAPLVFEGIAFEWLYLVQAQVAICVIELSGFFQFLALPGAYPARGLDLGVEVTDLLLELVVVLLEGPELGVYGVGLGVGGDEGAVDEEVVIDGEASLGEGRVLHRVFVTLLTSNKFLYLLKKFISYTLLQLLITSRILIICPSLLLSSRSPRTPGLGAQTSSLSH